MASQDRRASLREPLRLPIWWPDGRRGWTRDISADGVYVYLPGTFHLPGWCAFEIDHSPGRLRFRALAEVLRVEPGLGVTGLAMRFRARRFQVMR